MTRKTPLHAALQAPVTTPEGAFSPSVVRLFNDIINDRRIAAGPSQPHAVDSGEIAPDARYSFITVDTEGAAATDDLVTINSGNAGDVIYIRMANAARVVTLKHGSGNISISTGADLALSASFPVEALYDGTYWRITPASLDATLTSIAALGTAADKMIYTTAVDTWAETGLTAFARTLLDDATANDMRLTLGAGNIGNPLFTTTTSANARSLIGVIIGTHVQAYDDTLQSISALGTAADRIAYTTGVDTWAETALTATARTLLDDGSTAAMRTTLGVSIGSDVQAYDAFLASIAALGTGADKFIYTTGIDTAAEATVTSFARTVLDDTDASAARTTLGLAIGTDVEAHDATLTAFAGWANGVNKIPYTTASDTFASLDFKDEDDMASDSATAVPSQQSVKAYVDANAGGTNDFDLLAVYTPSGATSVDITSIISSTYDVYEIEFYLTVATDNVNLWIRTSTDNTNFDTGASDYSWTRNSFSIENAAPSIASTGDNADAQINCAAGIGNAAAEGVSGRIMLINPLGTARNKILNWEISVHNPSTQPFTNFGGGQRLSTGDVTALQFKASLGNISGIVKISGKRAAV
jgi:hypothetical protein